MSAAALRVVTATALVGVCALYFAAPVYRFSPPSTFGGSTLLNPYAGVGGQWRQANLHAHAWSWRRSSPDGKQDAGTVLNWYRLHHYEIEAIANHQRIADPRFPIYEHGYAPGKQHLLALGVSAVTWFELPWRASVSAKQAVIDRVHAGAALVAISHPLDLAAYADSDFVALGNYELMEVVNGNSLATSAWDIALSSGHLVWALGSDDSHDIEDARRTGSAWTMIDAGAQSPSEIFDALRSGRAYAVKGTAGRNDVTLQRLEAAEDTLHIELSGPATITFIGQDGRTLKVVPEANRADYQLKADDTYVRTRVRTAATSMFLNPVVRQSSATTPSRPAVDSTRTALLRLALLAVASVGVTWATGPWRRRRRG